MAHVIVTLLVFYVSACFFRACTFMVWIYTVGKHEHPQDELPSGLWDWYYNFMGGFIFLVPNEMLHHYSRLCALVNPGE